MMAHGGFLVKGARPPSASSSHRPSSATFKHGYHILGTESTVDELLFRSHHPTRLDKTIINFKAPWEHPKPESPPQTYGTVKHKPELKSKPQGHPLLWCPTPGTAVHARKKAQSRSSLDDSAYLWSTRDHFRHLKHTPSFVDESLFGPRLKEPSFEAPWNVRKNGENIKSKLYTLDLSEEKGASSQPTGVFTDSNMSVQRPATALGISRSKGKFNCDTRVSKPVWRP